MIDRAQLHEVLADLDKALGWVASHWHEHYPYGICTIYSLISAPILRCALAEPDLRVVIGTYLGTNHCWLYADDLNIDLTFGQFDPQSPHPWRVSDAMLTDGYTPRAVLDLDEEDHYRRTIDPSGNTKIKQDFWSDDLSIVRGGGQP